MRANLMSRPTETVGRYPLHLYNAALAIALIALTGSVIAWLNYAQGTRLVLGASEQLFDRIQREVVADLAYGSRINHLAVETIALAKVGAATRLSERLESLPLFRAVLHGNDRLLALYIGCEDGAFFHVAPLPSAKEQARYAAPAGAAYRVWSIERLPGGSATSASLFFDDDLRLLAQRPAANGPLYDPRERPWYIAARGGDGLVATRPYVFYETHEVGSTLARRGATDRCVVAGDIALGQLSAILASYDVSPTAELAIVDDKGEVLGYRGATGVARTEEDRATLRLTALDTLGTGVLARLAEVANGADRRIDIDSDGRTWKAMQRRFQLTAGMSVFLMMAAPLDELLAEAQRIRRQSVVATALLILAAIPIAWLASRLLATPLRRLAGEVKAIQAFDFRQPVTTRSIVLEIDGLADAMGAMKQTIRNFLGIATDLAAEHQFAALLERVCRETMHAVDADGAVVYLLDDGEASLRPAGLALRAANPSARADTFATVPVHDAAAVARGARQESPETLVTGVDELAAAPDGAAVLAAALGWGPLKANIIPLKNQRGASVGVLALLARGERAHGAALASEERIAFATALAGVAATAIDNQRLYRAQKALLDAFIRLVAGAIDAKSPYTGGHCQRVPVLTQLLAKAACQSDAPPFREFTLDSEEWEALDIACWLHDCGKVTTPEYVVDKATKLETLYDRLHEIRMRFEVLKRDAEIDCWKAIAAGAERVPAEAQLQRTWRDLDEEYAFVAACNEGGEAMAPERVLRLQQIAQRTWRRTLDDRIGIATEERRRKDREPARPLPALERLLADKLEHLVYREPSERIAADNRWGFRLDAPEYKYNRGELHNLSVARGTLTPEERYVINHHIVQTIMMLSELPFPKHLRRVPEFAGGHHETLDGMGYPKRLTRADMSLPARMMAIADIFEALTAGDRPYKKPKPLSDAIRIMAAMRDRAHIDPDLFELFLASGVYREYAERFLDAEQIDAVDISQYIGAAGR